MYVREREKEGERKNGGESKREQEIVREIAGGDEIEE